MNTRLIATLTTLSLTALSGTAVFAEESDVTLEWQQPGYTMEVVRVTAKRPESVPVSGTDAAIMDEAVVTTDVTPAWQEPGYEPELLVVTASRSEVLADFRAEKRARATLSPRRAAWMALGAPAR